MVEEGEWGGWFGLRSERLSVSDKAKGGWSAQISKKIMYQNDFIWSEEGESAFLGKLTFYANVPFF